MEKLRCLLVGCGARGRVWDAVVGALPEATVVGYVDVDPGRAEALAGPERPFFIDLERAIEAVAPEAVLLVTPPQAHPAQVRVCVEQRLPMLVEKPLAEDLGEAVRLVDLAQSAGVPLSVSMQFRYLPVTQAKKRLLAEGACGRPGFALFSYLRNRDGLAPQMNKYPLTMMHPMLLEQTVHHYDLIRYVYKAEPVWVQADSWNPHWSMYRHDSNVATLMELDNGMRLTYLGTWTAGWNTLQFQWRTDGGQGVVEQRELFSGLFRGRPDDPALEPVPLPEARPFVDDSAELLRRFVRALRDGAEVPCSGADHLKTLAMVFAAMESAAERRAVDLEQFGRRSGLLG